jgi:hypothetical protein
MMLSILTSWCMKSKDNTDLSNVMPRQCNMLSVYASQASMDFTVKNERSSIHAVPMQCPAANSTPVLIPWRRKNCELSPNSPNACYEDHGNCPGILHPDQFSQVAVPNPPQRTICCLPRYYRFAKAEPVRTCSMPSPR